MGWQVGIVTSFLMVVLRIALPLVLTFAVAHALRRLDARWQAEENYSVATVGPMTS